ncbi:homocysteine S-methyltransferase family protein [Holophaga foetida]|uniref:homocysteine S-methyltransferase family protein n=1 Tax=Holophaga foetida TaxID=35839 RepID=UPI0002471C57|nr:homocysteine S-methyltransferase family protein [Holophaga foetida]
MENIKEALAAGKLLIADGATGTMLMAAGLPSGSAPELWNVERPEEILALYRAYIDAGSNIFLTNTFGGNRTTLARHGLGDRVRELNMAGARLAREAAGDRAYVAGDMGPTGALLKPYGPMSAEEALEVYTEQAAALAEGGVDLLWIETMSELSEIKAAIQGALTTGLPVFCTMSFDANARTMMGVRAKMAAQQLWPMGLAAIGLNCGEGLEMVPNALRQMKEGAPEAVLIAKPNAGLPRVVDGKTVYDVTPRDFAETAASFVELGAQVLGSCCGSGPAYIKALSERFQA